MATALNRAAAPPWPHCPGGCSGHRERAGRPLTYPVARAHVVPVAASAGWAEALCRRRSCCCDAVAPDDRSPAAARAGARERRGERVVQPRAHRRVHAVPGDGQHQQCPGRGGIPEDRRAERADPTSSSQCAPADATPFVLRLIGKAYAVEATGLPAPVRAIGDPIAGRRRRHGRRSSAQTGRPHRAGLCRHRDVIFGGAPIALSTLGLTGLGLVWALVQLVVAVVLMMTQLRFLWTASASRLASRVKRVLRDAGRGRAVRRVVRPVVAQTGQPPASPTDRRRPARPLPCRRRLDEPVRLPRIGSADDRPRCDTTRTAKSLDDSCTPEPTTHRDIGD